MKTLFLALTLVTLTPAFGALPEVIEVELGDKALIQHEHVILARGKDHLSLKFKDGGEHYVEKLEVKMKDQAAARVVIDGGYAATLGGTDKPQDYPMVVRSPTQEITIKAAQTNQLVRVESVRIHTRRHDYSSYRNLSQLQRKNLALPQMGERLNSLVEEFTVLSTGTPFAHDTYGRFLKPMKAAAQDTGKSAPEKDKTQKLLSVLDEASVLFESDIMLLDGRYEILAKDFAAMKTDLKAKLKETR